MPLVNELLVVPGADKSVCHVALPRSFSANEQGVFCDCAIVSMISGFSGVEGMTDMIEAK